MLDTKPLSAQIEAQLKREIMSGDLEPGQRLTIEDIAERLHVSRMPVRDAVRRLDGLGFLKVAPRRGVYVEEFDQTRFKNTMEIRIALESLAVELATTRIPLEAIEDAQDSYRRGGDYYARTGDLSQLAECDNLIHDLIINCSENPLLIEMMRQLQDLINWAHQIVAKYRPGAQVDALPEHMEILDALRRRDVAATKSAVRDHLLNTLERTLLAWDHKTGAA
ncbi:MAG: GntR family transcriptional regulator [Chloroflexota bacterium]|nr:GntR family transcriptional regulator [Chloroflexota bacterium]